MSEHKYYLTVNNQTVAEGVTCEYALIFTKALIEHFYNDHDIVIAIAELGLVQILSKLTFCMEQFLTKKSKVILNLCQGGSS